MMLYFLAPSTITLFPFALPLLAKSILVGIPAIFSHLREFFCGEYLAVYVDLKAASLFSASQQLSVLYVVFCQHGSLVWYEICRALYLTWDLSSSFGLLVSSWASVLLWVFCSEVWPSPSTSWVCGCPVISTTGVVDSMTVTWGAQEHGPQAPTLRMPCTLAGDFP